MRKSFGGPVLVAALLTLGACQAADQMLAPTPGKVEFDPARSCTITDQAGWDALKAAALALYVDGSPSESQAAAKIDNMIKQCDSGNFATAEQKAWDLANFTLQKFEQGSLAAGITEDDVNAFIGELLAAAGVMTVATNTWVIEPTDGTKTFLTEDGKASLTVSGADVDATTVITANPLPFDSLGQAASYLATKLDQYPRYYHFTKTSQDGSTSFKNPVVVAICVLMPNSVGDEVFQRLRLGHQNAVDGFSVADSAGAPSVLDCDGDPNTTTRLGTGARLRGGATGVAPAIIGDDGSGLEERGGVGGLADNFSDFGVVDPYADARGGVGGLADNFRPGSRPLALARMTSRGLDQVAASHDPSATTCASLAASVGSALPPECRPTVTVQTPIGNTNLLNVPVTFTVTGGGGQIALENPSDHSCGTFGTTVTVPTALYASNGPTQARVCWTLGSSPGDNTVSATVAPGGDAPDAGGFIYEGSGAETGSSIEFTATAQKLDPTATANDVTVAFSGQPVVGTGTCNPNTLASSVTYSTADGQPPTAQGSYDFTFTCLANALYNEASDLGTITIGSATSNLSVSCPASATYTGSALTPCTATVTGAGGLNQNLTVTYTNNVNGGTATANASFDGGANWTPSSGSATFTILPAATTTTVTCSAGPFTFDGSAQTPCSASVTGPNGLSQLVTVTYTNNVGAGTATASASYSGDSNYEPSSDSETFTIDKAATTTTVSCFGGPYAYTGSAITPCSATVTGPGSLNQSLTVSYSNNTNAGSATASASYPGNGNYNPSSDSQNFTIGQAATTTIVSCTSGPHTYTGSALTPCSATVTGPGLNQSIPVTYSNNVNAGTASASASFAATSNHLGSTGSQNFTIGQASTTTTVTCGAGPYTYNGVAQTPCSASVTGVGGLNQSLAVSYSNSTNAGTATASASFAGTTNYASSLGSATFTINPRTATATAGSATINFGDPLPSSLPCTVTGLLAGDGGTCTTSIPSVSLAGTYATTPSNVSISPVASNYSVNSVNGTLTIRGYVQVDCFAAPVYSVMPPTKAAQRDGSNIPIKCTLRWPDGSNVTNATGDLEIWSAQTNGTPISRLFTLNGAFTPSSNGNYSYGLDTGLPGFVAGSAYYVKAVWNDGSSTVGYFRLK